MSSTIPSLAGSAVILRSKPGPQGQQPQAVIVVGGSSMEDGPRNTAYAIDLRTPFNATSGPKMNQVASLPIPLSDPIAAVTSNGRIRVFGGSTTKWAINKEAFELDVDKNTWISLAVPAPGIDLLGQACIAPVVTGVAGGDVVYSFGGVETGSTPERFNADLKRISIKDPITVLPAISRNPAAPAWPDARAAGVLAPINDTHLLLSGGRDPNNISKSLSDWWTYDMPNNVWVKGNSVLAVARYSHRVTMYNSRIALVSGGWADTAPATLIEVIDLAAGTVSPLSLSGSAPSPTYLTRHNSLLVDDRLMLFGGFANWNANADPFTHVKQLYMAKLSADGGSVSGLWQSDYVPPGYVPPSGASTGPETGSTSSSSSWFWAAIGAGIGLVVFALLAFLFVRRRSRSSKSPQAISIPPRSDPHVAMADTPLVAAADDPSTVSSTVAPLSSSALPPPPPPLHAEQPLSEYRYSHASVAPQPPQPSHQVVYYDNNNSVVVGSPMDHHRMSMLAEAVAQQHQHQQFVYYQQPVPTSGAMEQYPDVNMMMAYQQQQQPHMFQQQPIMIPYVMSPEQQYIPTPPPAHSSAQPQFVTGYPGGAPVPPQPQVALGNQDNNGQYLVDHEDAALRQSVMVLHQQQANAMLVNNGGGVPGTATLYLPGDGDSAKQVGMQQQAQYFNEFSAPQQCYPLESREQRVPGEEDLADGGRRQ